MAHQKKGKDIIDCHDRVGWLANRPWLKAEGLEFIFRKTELPIQNAGDADKEEVFLHVHVAVRSTLLLGKDKYAALLAKIKKQWGRDYTVHDAGLIKDEEKQSNYLFKNPLASHEEDPQNPRYNHLTYESLEKLSPIGTRNLYEALHGKRLCHAMGEFAEFKKEIENKATQQGKDLTYQASQNKDQVINKLIKVPKIPKPSRDPAKGPLENYTTKRLSSKKRIVKNYTGVPTLPLYVKGQQLTSANSPGKVPLKPVARKLEPTKWLIKKTGEYVRRLGEKEFQTREIEVESWYGHRTRYDHHLINPALERISWLTPVGKGRGEWRRWKVNTRHKLWPKWNKAKRDFPPENLAIPGCNYFVPIVKAEKYPPGFYRTKREALRRKKRKEYQAKYLQRKKTALLSS